MPRPLADRIAVVTGAAHGIGAAVTAELADRGALVVAVDRAPVPAARRVTPVRGNVTDPATLTAALAAAGALGGPARILVQGAFSGVPTPLDQQDDGSWDTMLHTVLTAARRFDTAFLRALPVGTSASIVHVASPHAHGAVPGFAAYAAAKAGLLALTRAVAVEWGGRGVRCNAVAPGFVPVERNRHVWSDPRLGPALLRANPLGRHGTATEVARAVAFLAGDDASFVNGTCLAVDGGATAMLPEALLR